MVGLDARGPPPRSPQGLTNSQIGEPTRLRILHAIHLAGEVSPSDIAEAVGASQQTVSNQLQRLADQRIVHARRDGQRVLYRIINPCVPGLMDLGVCLLDQRP